MNSIKRLTSFLLTSLMLSSCAGVVLVPPTLTATQPPPSTQTPTVTAEPPTATSTVQVDTSWQAEYFNNDQFQGLPALTRVDPEPNFDWFNRKPAPEIPDDFFTVRWTRCLNMEERTYMFTLSADDYARVLVDDVQILETPLPPDTAIPYDASAGPHCIKVEYREFIGHAFVFFSFK